MTKKLKKVIALLLTLVMVLSMTGTSAFAMDLTGESAAASGETWSWDAGTKTLTLDGATINENVSLPDGSTIVLNGDSSIAGGEENAITCDGALTIQGEGKLTATGAHGIQAASVAIKGIDVDITGTSCGIYVPNAAGDAAVTLTSVDGSIEGGYAGIYVCGDCEGSAAYVTIEDCDLDVASTATTYNSRARKSGIVVYVSKAEMVESSITINNSKVNATGSDAGLCINNYVGDADATNSASSRIDITNSTVVANGTNGTWAGIFASVLGQHADADSIITIKDSSVYAVSPNTGILTSSQAGESKIILDNSVLGASGKTALSMVEETSQAQVAEIKNGSTYIQMTPAAVNNGEISIFDGKVIAAVEGEITYNAENNYYVIPQNAVVTETYTDGIANEYTFTEQAGGVGGFSYTKEEVWGYDIPFKWETGDIIITTPEELIEFAEYTQDGTLGDCTGRTVKLGADIDMTGYDWYYRNAEGEIVTDHRIPKFSGIFDGQGYTISNMSYKDEYKEATDPMPLAFILTANGTFKEFTINGITVNTVAPARFGGLADALAYCGEGYTEGVTVKNIVVNADAQLAFGGFAFKILDVAEVKDCHVDGFTVNANGVLNGPNSGRCGGFVATGGEQTPFKDCSVSDFVLNAESTGTYVGGFIGGASMTASYTNCVVDGFELNAKAKLSSVGGFAGYTAGSAWGEGLTFTDCSVKGLDIETANVISYGTGGFIGNLYGQGKSLENGAHHFVNCTTEGTISGDTYAGGFVGWLYGRSNGCVAEFTNCYAAVNVLNNDYEAGGFVGKYAPSGSNKMTAVYNNCTASGDIFGKEPIGSFLDADTANVDGIIGGTYNYDPENVDTATGEVNNVAPGYRALDNGDGTWTVFPDNGKEVVKVAFHRWNDELNDYENWRTVEVFKDVDFFEDDYDNALNYSHPDYRFANGIGELDEEADDATEQEFLYWTDVPYGSNLVLDNEIEVVEDMNAYAAYKSADSAVVLTIDMSGTMYRNKMNGTRYVDVAKAKALAFVEEYAASADDTNAKRMLAVVSFDTDAKVQQTWIDVSTASGLATAKTAINNMKVADNGKASSNQVCTNFDGGVILTRNMLKQDAVKDISKSFAIILSDGAPTVTVNADTDAVGTIKSSFWGKQYTAAGVKYQNARCGGGWTHPAEVESTLKYLATGENNLADLTCTYTDGDEYKEGIFIVGVGGLMNFKLFNDAVYGTSNGTRTSDVKKKPAAFNNVEALAGYTSAEIMKLTTGDWMNILADHVGGTYVSATDSAALEAEFDVILDAIQTTTE